MVTPLATPEDVRSRVNIDLDGESIEPYLKDAAFENARANDIDAMADDLRQQIEWRLAAIKILSYRKGSRAYHSQSLGSMNRSYETRMLNDLRAEVRDLDPSGDLGSSTNRDGDRTVTVTDQEAQ